MHFRAVAFIRDEAEAHTYPSAAIKPSPYHRSEALYCIKTFRLQLLNTLNGGAAHTRGGYRGGEAALAVAVSAGPSGAGEHLALIGPFWPVMQKRFTVIAGNTEEFWMLSYLRTYKNFSQ